MSKTAFLAIDLGATSGRAILATLSEGRLEMKEIHRFPNATLEILGKYYWDVASLYLEIKKGLLACAREGVTPASIGIDTWGVDFGYVASDGTLLGLPRAYRDPYTEGIPEKFFAEKLPSDKVYSRAGIQVMNFNTLFQLYAQKLEGSVVQANAAKALFMPDLLSYMLTGNAVCEYTIASTSGFLDPVGKDIDRGLVAETGIDPSLFAKPVFPGTIVGYLTDELARETGLGKVPVVAVAGHDTASAVAAVPAENEEFAYLSSGTWSLMGVELPSPVLTAAAMEKNFTNEGGVEGTTRFLKNITGMWVLEQCRKEWKKAGVDYSYPELVKMAQDNDYAGLINPDDPAFANPASMNAAIHDYCIEHGTVPPANDSETVRCIYKSLVERYRVTLEVLREMAPFKINKLHIIGGGAQNPLMNQWTADALGIPVLAGPSEATAIGNIMIQAQAVGLVKDRWEYRKLIAEAFKPEIYLPAKG